MSKAKRSNPGVRRYEQPPSLVGYTYVPEAAREAARGGRLLAIRVETSNACNFRCLYCNNAAGKQELSQMPFSLLKQAVAETASLGGKSVVVIGGGEPTLYPRFRALVSYINRKKMVPVVITNASRLDSGMARFLYDENASVLFKMDSRKAETQDYLAGKKGAHALIMKGIRNLFSAGFNKGVNRQLRCGASFVLTRYNYGEIVSLWKFCRDNHLFPNLEEFIPRGRGLLNSSSLTVAKDKVRQLKQQLLALDRRDYGYDWLVYAPLPGYGCLQHLYSVYVDIDGYVRPCADIEVRQHTIRKMKLVRILKTPFFGFVRNLKNHLQGKCFRCRHNTLCVGCRGNAFNVGLQEGLDVYKALSREDPVCWKR